MVAAGNPHAISGPEDLTRSDIRVVMASENEPGARSQYVAALNALVGPERTKSILARETVTFPGRLGIQHRDVPQAIEDGTGQVAIFFALPEDRNDEERPVATNKPTEFAADSALEGDGFEPSVPRSRKGDSVGEGEAGKGHGDDKRRFRDGEDLKRDRGFESISLQGRVVCEPACWRSWTRRGRVRSRSPTPTAERWRRGSVRSVVGIGGGVVSGC